MVIMHSIANRNFRLKFLLTTSITAIAMGVAIGATQANDLNGVDTAAGPITNLVGLGINQNVNVDTVDISSAVWGVAIWTLTGNVDVEINKIITAGGDGVEVNTRFPGDGGNVKIAGSGKIDAGLRGIDVEVDTGTIDIDGISGGIKSGSDGIYVFHNGSWAGLATPVGDVNIGRNTVIGDIDSVGFGIHSLNIFDMITDNTVKITTSDVKSVATAIWLQNRFDGDAIVDTTGGKVTSTAGYGILHNSTGGDVEVKTADVKSLTTSVWTTTVSGNNTVDTTAGSLDSGTFGVAAWTATGDVDVKTAVVKSVATSIWTINTTGTTDIDTTAGKVTSTAGHGVLHTSTTGNVDVKTADVDALLDGVWTTTTAGSNTVDTSAGGIKSGVDGVVAWTVGGDVDVKTAKVEGVHDGIWTSSNAGHNNVNSTDDVSATTGWGIYADSTSGDIHVDVTGGDVSSAYRGIQVVNLSTGNSLTDIATGSTVQGIEYGLLTGTITGLATVNNLGTIKDMADGGGPTDAGLDLSGDAIWAYAGNSIINNESGGVITGRVHSNGSTSFTMNNKSGATWNAGTLVNGFGAAGDTVNNAGLINIRNGITGFTALDNLNNQSGGIIDMQYSGGADDVLNGIVNFNTMGGSTLKFDVDFAAASFGDDSTSYGGGAGDTIYTLVANPTGVTNVAINAINRATQNSLIATSGSIALVNSSAAADLVNPGLGGLATMVASDNYTMVTDPSTGAVKFNLVEDADGGVYLQWAPNITASSMAGFTGGAVLGDEATSGASASGATAGLAGMGAGPGSGGVAGSIADAAGASAGNNDGCSVGKDGQDDTYSNASRAWISGTGSSSSFDGGSTGWDIGTAIGIEHDLGSQAGIGCGDLAIGLFAAYGQYGSDSASGSTDGSAKGGGVYLKAATKEGFYATGVVGASWSEADMTNSVFGSTATQDSMGYMGSVALGYSAAVSDSFGIDGRVFGTIAHSEGDGFTDSVGIVVDGSSADVRTVGFLLGANADVGGSTTAFVRGGAKWMTVDQEISAFGITVAGTAEVFVKTIEAGIESEIGNGATFSAKAFGDFTDNSDSYGGTLTVAFEL